MADNVEVDTLTTLGSGSAITAINANFERLALALDEVLYTDGREQLGNNLDINGYRLLNLPAPTYSTDAVRLADIEQLTDDATIALINSRLNFTQDGTGAVQRLITSKLKNGIIDVADFGAVGDVVEGLGASITGTDDTSAFTNALNFLALLGGGILQCFPGKKYKITSQLTIPEGVTLFLNGAKLIFVLSNANDCGLQVRSNCTVSGGHVRVISTGSPGAQASCHAPIRVGAIYGSGGTMLAPSADDNAGGWAILNMIVESDKDLGAVATGGAAGIAVQGNAHNGVISGINIPDNAKMSSGIGLDWGVRGEVSGNQAIVSLDSAMATNKTNFNAGNGKTTHPHDIIINDITIGQLSRPYNAGVGATSGTFGIRHAGCYGITVSDVLIGQTTESAFVQHAGDLGFEFADTNDAPFALKGNSFKNCKVINASGGAIFTGDSKADNVQRAITNYAYVPLYSWAALWPTDLICEQVRGGRSSSTPSYGFNLFDIDGGHLRHCGAKGFLNALRFSGAKNTLIEGGGYIESTGNCIKIEDSSSGLVLRDLRKVYTAGAGNAVVYIGVSDAIRIEGGSYGVAAGETGTHTIHAIDGACTNLVIRDVTVVGHGAGSYAIVGGGSSAENVVKLFNNVTYGTSVTNKYFGQYRRHADFGDGVFHATGEGSPVSVVTASPGSTFTRTNGGVGTTYYVKQTGTNTNTGWAAVA